jgi:hypothetical protein
MTIHLPAGVRFQVTPVRVTAGLILMILAFSLLFAIPGFYWFTIYAVFVVATVFVVRSVPVEPGMWLGRRSVRRGLVLLTTLIALSFLARPYVDPNVGGNLLLLLLVLCDLALGRATRRMASAPDWVIDERQEALRNHAHRLAYWMLAVAAGVTVLVADSVSPDTRRWLEDGIRGAGPVVTFIQFLFFLPAMVLAWLEPDRLTGVDAPVLRWGRRAAIATTMVAVALLTPLVLSLGLAVAPTHTSTYSRVDIGNGGLCRYFDARKQVGLGIGATIPLSAVVCWDGATASEVWGLNSSDCNPQVTDFAMVSTTTCRRTTGPDGTLRFTYEAVVRSPILPFVARDVVMTLAVAKDGRVVQFP